MENERTYSDTPSRHDAAEQPVAHEDGFYVTTRAEPSAREPDSSRHQSHSKRVLAGTSADIQAAAVDYATYVRTGNATALNQALHACASHVYTQAYRRLGNASDADDAAQEALLQLVRSAGRFDGTIPFHIWLALMVKTACLRQLRSDRRRRAREEIAMNHREPPCRTENQLAEDLRAKVALLSQADNTVIHLHYYAGLSITEVGAAVGASENAVVLRLSRARAKLRKLMGGKVTAAVLVSLLSAQPVYSATTNTLHCVATISQSVALGHTLPTHFISLTLSQKALLFMSLHPFSSCLCAVLIFLGGLTPIFLHSADAPSPAAGAPSPAVTNDNAPKVTNSPAGAQPWQGKGKELLPFLDPQASLRAAVDWQHLRQLAPNVKLTSLFSDQRAQKSLNHIATQFELFSKTSRSGERPDWYAVATKFNGLVFSAPGVEDNTANTVYALDESDANQLMAWVNKEGWLEKASNGETVQPTKMGSFKTWDYKYMPNTILAQSGGTISLSQKEFLKAGLARKNSAPPTAPIQVTLDAGRVVKLIVQLADKYGDLFEFDTVLGKNWRQSHPVLTVNCAAEDGVWRSRSQLSGNLSIPLRATSPAIAGCVTKNNLATVVVGCELRPAIACIKAVIGSRDVEQMLKGIGIDEATILQCLTGDLACMVRQGAVLPEGAIVLGLHNQTADLLAKKLKPLLKSLDLTAVDSEATQWKGIMPIGNLFIQFESDRLVISVGNEAPTLTKDNLKNTDSLAIDIDLPSLSRMYMPMLANLLPAPSETIYFDDPIDRFVYQMGWEINALYSNKELAEIGSKIAFDLRKKSDHHFPILEHWNSIPGLRGIPMDPHVGIFIREENNTADAIKGEFHVIFRTKDGWIACASRDGEVSVKDVADMTAVKATLDGLRQISTRGLLDLEAVSIINQPCFDRRWLPPLAAITDHMPSYRLRLQKTKDGFSSIEDGLPLFAALVTMAAAPDILSCSEESAKAKEKHHLQPYNYTRLQGLYLNEYEKRHSDEISKLREKYKTALAAIQKVRSSMNPRHHHAQLFLTPSSAFAANGVPLSDLAPLFANRAPSPVQVDALGFWRPTEFNGLCWLIPIEGEFFIEVSDERLKKDIFITTRSWISQSPLTDSEREELVRINEEREQAKERKENEKKGSSKSPDPVPVPDQANEF